MSEEHLAAQQRRRMMMEKREMRERAKDRMFYKKMAMMPIIQEERRARSDRAHNMKTHDDDPDHRHARIAFDRKAIRNCTMRSIPLQAPIFEIAVAVGVILAIAYGLSKLAPKYVGVGCLLVTVIFAAFICTRRPRKVRKCKRPPKHANIIPPEYLPPPLPTPDARPWRNTAGQPFVSSELAAEWEPAQSGLF